jgi:hypothetical protein
MDDSLTRWLRLREASDVSARSETLTRDIAATLPVDEPLYALDLATGAGSNIRYLAERLPGPQHWLAVDQSPELLADLLERMRSWGTARGYEVEIAGTTCKIHGPRLDCHVETLQLDLGVLNDRVLFSGRRLVTASALLDLASESWLRALAAHCRAEGASALFTITYSGHSSCHPREPEDEVVLELFNRHQRTDKGLGGPAAGPDAAATATRCFAETGFHVQRLPSNWDLTPTEPDMQRVLIDGWASAATEVAPRRARQISDWRARRLAHVDAGLSHVVVSHDDLAAWPRRGP